MELDNRRRTMGEVLSKLQASSDKLEAASRAYLMDANDTSF
jgi:hypothetical protein